MQRVSKPCHRDKQRCLEINTELVWKYKDFAVPEWAGQSTPHLCFIFCRETSKQCYKVLNLLHLLPAMAAWTATNVLPLPAPSSDWCCVKRTPVVPVYLHFQGAWLGFVLSFSFGIPAVGDQRVQKLLRCSSEEMLLLRKHPIYATF